MFLVLCINNSLLISLKANPRSIVVNALSACSMRHANWLGFHFRCAAMDGNLFIEVEIRRGNAGNEPRSATASQVLHDPLKENQCPALERDDVCQMYASPHHPSQETRDMKTKRVGDCGPVPNHRHSSFIAIFKWRQRSATLYFS